MMTEFEAPLLTAMHNALQRTYLHLVATRFPYSWLDWAVEHGLWSAEHATTLRNLYPLSVTVKPETPPPDLSPLPLEDALDSIARLATFPDYDYIKGKSPRYEEIIRLLPIVPPEALPALTEAIEAIDHTLYRVKSQIGLLEYLPIEYHAGLVAVAWSGMSTLDDPYTHADLIAALLPYVAEREQITALEKVLAAAALLPYPAYQIESVLAILPHTTDDLREKALELALQAGWEVENEERRDQLLARLYPHLTPAQQRDLLARRIAHAESIPTGVQWEQLELAARLSLYLSADDRAKLLAMTLALEFEGVRGDVLVRLMPYLSPDDQRRIPTTGLRPEYTLEIRARQLALLPDAEQADAFRALVAALHDLDSSLAQLRRIGVMANALSGEWRAKLIEIGFQIAKSLLVVPTNHPELTNPNIFVEGKDSAQFVPSRSTFYEERWREAILQIIALWPQWSEAQQAALGEAMLNAVRAIRLEAGDLGVPSIRGRLLGGILPYVRADVWPEIVEELLTIAAGQSNLWFTAQLLAFTQPIELDEAKATVRSALLLPVIEAIPHLMLPWQKTNTIQHALGLLPETARAAFIESVLPQISAYPNTEDQVDAFAVVLPYLMPLQREMVMTALCEAVRQTVALTTCAALLDRLLPHLTADENRVCLEVFQAKVQAYLDEESALEALLTQLKSLNLPLLLDNAALVALAQSIIHLRSIS